MKNSLIKFLPIVSIMLLASCAPGNSSSSQIPSEESLSSEEVSSESPSSSEEESSEQPSSEEVSSEESSEPEVDPYNRPELFLTDNPYVDEKSPLPDYEATLFDNDSFKLEESNKLADGVYHKVYSFNLNSGKKVIANTVDVDLTNADIKTEYHSTKDTVFGMIEKFENEQNIQVLAGINADFFGSNPVNAYVKDGTIIKAGHNDNGLYDYKNLSADIPASMPMLLGATGTSARIAPIVEGESVKTTIQSEFYVKMFYAGEDKEVHEIPVQPYDELNTYKNKSYGGYTILYDAKWTQISPSRDDTLFKIKLFDDQHAYTSGVVEEKITCTNSKIFLNDIDEGYIYLHIEKDNETYLEVGDQFAFTIGSNDSHWNGYQNIIGGRQSLVEDGDIAPTVTLENSNGAQSTNIPRSAVGVTDENHVLLVGIESLRYNKNNTVQESDSYGVSLPELAEFMRKAGCYDAMNLDGGGSTQLITSTHENPDDYNLVVRSSDYASYTLTSCRKVINSILVTAKS